MNFEQLMSLFGAVAVLVGGAWALIKIVVWQFERRLDERFVALEQARKDGRQTAQAQLADIDSKVGKLALDLKGAESAIARHAEQIARVESDVKHIPTHDDIGGVYRELQTVSGGVQSLNGEMKALRGQVELITRHMLDQH